MVPFTAFSKKYQNENESIRFCLENIQFNITFFRDFEVEKFTKRSLLFWEKDCRVWYQKEDSKLLWSAFVFQLCSKLFQLYAVFLYKLVSTVWLNADFPRTKSLVWCSQAASHVQLQQSLSNSSWDWEILFSLNLDLLKFMFSSQPTNLNLAADTAFHSGCYSF